jgi:hypothetical protein
LVITTAAFGTAAIILRRIRSCRTCFILPLVTFRSFEFFLQLADGHLLPFVPLPVLEKVIGSGDDREHGNHGTQELEGQG